MKVQANELSHKEKTKTLDALYTAASVVKGRGAMKDFLRDLLTESERIMLGRRILIAQELLSGTPHADISESMNVGYDTISRIQTWLDDQVPGYELAVKEMQRIIGEREKKRRLGRMYADETFAGAVARLKQRYPMHFLLVPWPDKYSRKKSKLNRRKK